MDDAPKCVNMSEIYGLMIGAVPKIHEKHEIYQNMEYNVINDYPKSLKKAASRNKK